MTDVKLPELADGVNKAVVSFWHMSEGDSINVGDDLVEMLTDKATFNVPSPISGTLTKISVEEGEEIRVGDTIATIEEE